MTLDSLPLRQRARISGIDWDALRPSDAKRMRELGFDEDVAVENLHHAPLGRDPIACRVGRMTIAVRRREAAAITVAIESA